MQGEQLPKETVQAIQALRRDGVSVRKTAKLLGVSKKSVERHGLEAGAVGVPSRTKNEREAALEKIIDLSADRLVDILETEEKISPPVLNTVMGTAWDKRYGKEVAPGLPVNQFLINLFGAGGVGEKLMKIIPQGLPEPTASLKPEEPTEERSESK